MHVSLLPSCPKLPSELSAVSCCQLCVPAHQSQLSTSLPNSTMTVTGQVNQSGGNISPCQSINGASQELLVLRELSIAKYLPGWN